MSRTFILVGGGLVGLATALKLQERFPGVLVRVLEKEAITGAHQSTHNSGVLHCGLYYKPGSLKARMAVTGIREMTAFCQQHGIVHEICGKVVVAAAAHQLPQLDELERRGRANGLAGVRRLSADELKDIEPHATGMAALHVPQEGIVDYRAVCDRMADLIIRQGGEVRTGARVEQLRQSGGEWIASTPAGEFTGSFLVNCAGLHSDRVCSLSGQPPPVRIIPFRGEYYKLRTGREHLVRHLIYPVPDPAFPFLGVHFTRMIHGGVECGPNAVLAFAREGYSLGRISPRDLSESLLFPGLWRFLRRYPSMAGAELLRSFSRESFCRSLQELVPDVRSDDVVPGGAGVRAQAMTPQGELVQDFSLAPGKNFLHVLNAPSPGATASLAIGGHIASEIPT